MFWRFTNAAYCKLCLVTLLLQHSLGTDLLEYEKRQGMIPLARIGRAAFLKALEEKMKNGGMVPSPRLGRHVWESEQGFMPYPRIGRLAVDQDSLDYDILFGDDDSSSDLFDVAEDFMNEKLGVQKRPNIKLIPRVGRKKRSVSSEGQEEENQSSRNSYPKIAKIDSSRSAWNDFLEKRAIFIPRVGRGSFISAVARGSPKLKYKSRGIFIPRVGRRSD